MIENVSNQLPLISTPKAEGPASGQEVFNAPAQSNSTPSNELSKEEKAQVDQLRKTDQEVRAHEQAHKNVGGQFAGSATYSYQVGPDGKRYAVGGEVPIDTAPIKDNPEATLAKLDVVIAAALAPANPSAQDRKVAAAAVAARNQARAELSEKRKADEAESGSNTPAFDVNDFGTVPKSSINKAYAISNELGQTNDATGNNFNVTS